MRSIWILVFVVLCALLASAPLALPAQAGLAEGEAAYARRDLRTAVRELRPLAEAGDARAQYLMGNIARFNQEGGRENPSESIAWYRKAAAQGLPEAQRELAFLLLNAKPPQTGEAIGLYRAAADRGDAEAQYQLGVLYDRGLGVRPDFAQRQAWWDKAAAQNYAPALFALGTLAASGDGVKQDQAEAVRLFRAAAEHGSAEGGMELARALRDGRGVARDPAQAWQWYSFAIALTENGGTVAARAIGEERARLAPLLPAAARGAAEARARQQAAAFKPAPQPRRTPVGDAPPPPPPRR